MDLSNVGLKHYTTQYPKLQELATQENLGRIFSEHKTDWDMVTASGPIKGIILTTMRQKTLPADLPKVGDWVVYEIIPGERKAKILRTLPRYSVLSRFKIKDEAEQIIAANIDLMFLVLSVDQIYNAMQLNRYLTIAQNGGITPVIVINKTDKARGANSLAGGIKKLHPTLKIISTSAKTKIGLQELERNISAGQTAVLVGNSGAGKSSIVNALLADSRQATKNVGNEGRGRHTTTRREMFVLPNGGVVIDTPGMRTLETSKSSGSIFSELEVLSRNCKFRNCDHIKSSGCALQKALVEKTITEKQLQQFIALTNSPTPRPSYHKSSR
ncbi:ribosome small subunit-dependent GTPase A [bacterium]|nr:MAG: ribosome small subunit-dependent GTPase A [bacterium]